MSEITLTRKQEEALKLTIDRYRHHEPYTVISGYAGSGKSTLIKFIIEALDIPEDKVAYVAYTGKAANVLKNKGCPNATTAHKLLYDAQKTLDGGFIFKPKKRLDADYRLIVVDEVSMLPEELWNQLLSHHIYVLAAGDPGQLPPVKSNAAPILANPHVFLDEIMRQAQDSAIIRLSMHIREGKDFRTFPTVSGEVRIVPHRYQFADEDSALLQASQVICSTNKERNNLNQRIRALQGRGSVPEAGDKLIGLDNHWDCLSLQGNALTNGAVGITPGYTLYNQTYTKNPLFEGLEPTTLMLSQFITDDGDTFDIELPMDYKCIITGEPALTPQQEGRIAMYQKKLLGRAMKHPEDDIDITRYWKVVPYHFNYGYAITCWKAQGSQYPFVLGYDAAWVKKQRPDEYIKYMYTMCTRATDKVIMVGD